MDDIIQYSNKIKELITDKKELKSELEEKNKEFVTLTEEAFKLENSMLEVNQIINEINNAISRSKKVNKVLCYLLGGLTITLAIVLMISKNEFIVPTIIGYLSSLVLIVEIATANHRYKFIANKALDEKTALLKRMKCNSKVKEMELTNIKAICNSINSSINAIDEKISSTQREVGPLEENYLQAILVSQREGYIGEEEVEENIAPKEHKSKKLTI